MIASRRFFNLIGFLLFIILFISCSLDVEDSDDLTIKINQIEMGIYMPDNDSFIESIEIVATNSNEDSKTYSFDFSDAIETSEDGYFEITLDDITVGNWELYLKAYDYNENLLATASYSSNNDQVIDFNFIQGEGNLDLDIDWNDDNSNLKLKKIIITNVDDITTIKTIDTFSTDRPESVQVNNIQSGRNSLEFTFSDTPNSDITYTLKNPLTIFKGLESKGNFTVDNSISFTEHRIEASDNYMYFGSSVSMSGNYAIIGANNEFNSDNDSSDSDQSTSTDITGKAYIFEYNSNSNNWEEKNDFIASDTPQNNDFGCSVSIDGDTALIGNSYGDTKDGSTSSQYDIGAVYFYKRSSEGLWSNEVKIIPDDIDEGDGDGFACSVDLSGDYAIIGSHTDDVGSLDEIRSGSAYIYKRNNTGSWLQEVKLIPRNPEDNDEFGNNVAIYANPDNSVNAIVSAPYKNENRGCVYIYSKDSNSTSWNDEPSIIEAPNGCYEFGSSIDIYGDSVIIGAMTSVEEEENGGCVFIYSISDIQNSPTLLSQSIETVHDFGSTISIYNDTVAISASSEETDGEMVYIYKKDSNNQWSENCKILPRDEPNNRLFTTSISLTGENIIITAPNDMENEEGPSYSFIYEF